MSIITAVKDEIKKFIPGTTEYAELESSQREGQTYIKKWHDLEITYSKIIQRVDEGKSYYFGEAQQQVNQATAEGTMRIIPNVGATVLDLMLFILTKSPPTIQARPAGTSKLEGIEANIKESLIRKAFADADFKKKYRDSISNLLIVGFFDWFPYWDTEQEFGKARNHFNLSVLNPSLIRIMFRDTDFDTIDSFMTLKRMSQEWVMKKYNITPLPDRENPYLTKLIYGKGIDDDKVSVMRNYDEKNVKVIIGNQVVDTKSHGLDFAPCIHVRNKPVLNEPFSIDEIARFKPITQELVALISASSEIARDLAYPPILEYNNALGGMKITKWRGKKIPVRRSDKGEAIEYMTNKASMEGLLNQIKLLLDLFHFISLMPKAAAGIFEGSVTSGFQAKLSMQPATLNTDNKKIDIEVALIKLARIALFMIEKNDPKALEVKLDNGQEVKFENIWEGEFEVMWPENLPIDISREIQNLILGIQNSLTSVTQSVDKYNALMGMGSPDDTRDYLQQEANQAELAPERALKVAQVKETLARIEQATQAMQQAIQAPGPMAEAQAQNEEIRNSQNPNNAALQQGNSLADKQASPDTAREAVPPESTGGTTLQGV